MIGMLGSPPSRKYACSECGSTPSTVRVAATRACPTTWPPNTRRIPTCGLMPRYRLISSCSRSRIESRPATDDMKPPYGQWYTSAMPNTKRTDILIGGAGFAGLALAIALRQGLGDSFLVTVADPALGNSHSGDARASAIAAAARRLFETLGVWDKVADGAQPILDMVVTDSKLHDVMRPTYLTFAGEVQPGEPFAHMIENGPLVDALMERARADGVELRAEAVTGSDVGAERIDIQLGGGDTIAAKLLVAADGARSAIREAAGIRSVGWSYDQSAIVTTVKHERDHRCLLY